MEFLKDYGSLIFTVVCGFLAMVWKAAHVVKQVETLTTKVDQQHNDFNARIDHLESQFEKLDEKLDRILCQRV